MIIYDRACRLHTYCLRREPFFFRNTVFRVDIMHYRNHVGCSEGYDPSIYRDPGAHSSTRNMPYVNTQAAEQCNAALQLIRTPAAFMTAQHFMQYARLFLAYRNMRKIAALKKT